MKKPNSYAFGSGSNESQETVPDVTAANTDVPKDFDPLAFGKGAGGEAQEANQTELGDAAEDRVLVEQIRLISEKAGQVGDFAMLATYPEAGYDQLPLDVRSPHESIHDSIHGPQIRDGMTPSQLDKMPGSLPKPPALVG